MRIFDRNLNYSQIPMVNREFKTLPDRVFFILINDTKIEQQNIA